MKAHMNPHAKHHLKRTTRCTLAALLLMSGSHAALAAALPTTDTKSPTVVEAADVVVERTQSINVVDADAKMQINGAANIIIADADANDKKRVIITQTGPLSGDAFSGGAVNLEVIMSEALSGIADSGLSVTSAKSIKNAPYSAEVISEKIQNLPDGNQIVKRTTSLAYRDSAGRTRQETRDDKNEVRSIHINDAVGNARYILSPAQKTAAKITIDKDISKLIDEFKAKGKSGGHSEVTTVVVKGDDVHATSPGETIVSKRSEDGKEIHTTVTIKRLANDGGASTINRPHVRVNEQIIASHIDEAMKSHAMTFNFSDSVYAAKAVTRDLGSKNFDGVAATGKVSSYTIPAGAIGNKNPLTVATETWYSPDLQVTVYSKKSDPRSGETIYRLANVKRSEQPLTLFSVPGDYTIKDVPPVFLRTKEVKEIKETK